MLSRTGKCDIAFLNTHANKYSYRKQRNADFIDFLVQRRQLNKRRRSLGGVYRVLKAPAPCVRPDKGEIAIVFRSRWLLRRDRK